MNKSEFIKGIHQQVLNLTKVEEINQGLVSMNQYNAYKSNYEAVEGKILTGLGLSSLMTSDEFRYSR